MKLQELELARQPTCSRSDVVHNATDSQMSAVSCDSHQHTDGAEGKFWCNPPARHVVNRVRTNKRDALGKYENVVTRRETPSSCQGVHTFAARLKAIKTADDWRRKCCEQELAVVHVALRERHVEAIDTETPVRQRVSSPHLSGASRQIYLLRRPGREAATADAATSAAAPAAAHTTVSRFSSHHFLPAPKVSIFGTCSASVTGASGF